MRALPFLAGGIERTVFPGDLGPPSWVSLAVAEALQVILTNSCAGEGRFSVHQRPQTGVFLLKLFPALCISRAFSVAVGVPLRPLVDFARLIAVAHG